MDLSRHWRVQEQMSTSASAVWAQAQAQELELELELALLWPRGFWSRSQAQMLMVVYRRCQAEALPSAVYAVPRRRCSGQIAAGSSNRRVVCGRT